MINNIVIIGKESLLTKYISKKNKRCIIFSARNHLEIEKISKTINKLNRVILILNNFYPSSRINRINHDSYEKFYNQSIMFNAKLFAKLKAENIDKIIYSSSSAVYNSIRKDYQFVDSNNKSLYSSTKIASENLIYNFASKNKISFLILRIFNMYSDNDDKFSIISKLYKSINTKNEIKLFNNGENVRDFIHVKDVVKLIEYYIKAKNLKNSIYDIGVGHGTKLIDLINLLGAKKFNLKKSRKIIDEADISIAKNEILDSFNFIKLENFFLKKVKKISKKFNHYKQDSSNILQDIIDDYIIYGTGNAGKQVYQRLSSQNQKIYCFVDDDFNKQDNTLYGKKIISSKELAYLSKIKIIKNLIIAIPSLNQKKLEQIKEKFSPYINDIAYIPLKKTLKTEIISLADLDTYNTNEILKKKPKTINFKIFNKDLLNKKILITGAAGSIGSQLLRQLLNTNAKKIIGLDNSEIDLFNLKNELKNFKRIKFCLGDILDTKLIDYIIKNEKIDLIFHAAAYKHVGILQDNVNSAIRNNIFGTKSVLISAKKYNIPIVTISTDKAVRPTSILGLTKRISEILCLKYNKNNFSSKVVRFGNVFGSMGSAVPTFINQINNRMPITVTHKNVKRYFMTLNDACFLLLWSLKIKNAENVLVLNMGKPIKILDIIQSLINVKRKVDPSYFNEIKVIGLQKGEKMNEELTINKKTKKTKNADISLAQDPTYMDEEIDKLLYNLTMNIAPSASKKLMVNFIKKEYKKS